MHLPLSIFESPSSASLCSSLALKPSSLCTLTCLVRWSLRVKRLLHTLHTNLLSPVWLFKCLCNSSDLVNRLPQNNQLHTKDLSPVCQRKWALRWEVLLYTLPQPGTWQQCWIVFLRYSAAGPSLSSSWQLGQSQLGRPEG